MTAAALLSVVVTNGAVLAVVIESWRLNTAVLLSVVVTGSVTAESVEVTDNAVSLSSLWW